VLPSKRLSPCVCRRSYNMFKKE